MGLEAVVEWARHGWQETALVVERLRLGGETLLPWYAWMAVGTAGAYVAGRTAALRALEQLAAWLERRQVAQANRDRRVGAEVRGLVRETSWEAFCRRVESEWRRAGLPLNVWWVLGVHGTLAAAGGALGGAWLRNPALGVVLTVAGAWLPMQVLRWAQDGERRAVRAQLQAAVHFFAAEFQETHHVARSLMAAGRRAGGTVGAVMVRAGQRLAAGEPPSLVYRDLGEALAWHPHGRLFAQLCGLAHSDAGMAPLFSDLVLRMQQRTLLERRVRSAYSGMRTTVHILNALSVPALLAGIYVVPGGAAVYTGTVAGKAVVFLAALLVLAGFWFNSRLGRGDLEGV